MGQEISRVTRSRAEAAAAYTRMSRWYHLLVDPFERSYRTMGLQVLDVQPGERVLGVGFGSGEGLRALARAVGPGGRVTGIDLAAGMCRVADRLLSRAGLRGRVGLVCGDALRMPFRAGVFDALFMSFTLELFDTADIPRVLAECRRVLRPGGRLGLVAMAKGEHPGLMLALYEWAHRAAPALVDCRPIYPADALAQAGFTVTSSIRTATFGLPLDILLARAPSDSTL